MWVGGRKGGSGETRGFGGVVGGFGWGFGDRMGEGGMGWGGVELGMEKLLSGLLNLR